MKIKNLLETPIQVYRGLTSKNLPPRYPGTYYTELHDLAKKYAKQDGHVVSKTIQPKNPLIISKLIQSKERRKILNIFIAFLERYFPNIEPKDTQFFDILNNGVTDFSYPTEADNSFLKHLGYDSVYFEKEGGEIVKSWYLPNQ